MLVGGTAFPWIALAPQGRINLCYRGFAGGDLPAVERPEMDAQLNMHRLLKFRPEDQGHFPGTAVKIKDLTPQKLNNRSMKSIFARNFSLK
jgi:hypothetical protein